MEFGEGMTIREERDRREREKKKWFELLEGEDGANVCDSCPSVVEDRSGLDLDMKSIEESADIRKFLDGFFAQRNKNFWKHKRLFYAYFGLSEESFVEVSEEMGLSLQQAEDRIERILPRIQEAARHSKVLV